MVRQSDSLMRYNELSGGELDRFNRWLTGNLVFGAFVAAGLIFAALAGSGLPLKPNEALADNMGASEISASKKPSADSVFQLMTAASRELPVENWGEHAF
jgi:hypothetical protein